MWWRRNLAGSSRLIRSAVYGSTGALAMAAATMTLSKDEEHRTTKQPDMKPWHVQGPFKHPDDGVLIARRIVSDNDHTGLNLRLYQYEACPFCCKVRAFLNYYGFSYEVVEVSPLTRKEIKKLQDVTKLPTVIAETNRKLSDSSLIISILTSYMAQDDDSRSLDDVIELYPEVRSIVKETGKQTITHPNMYKIMIPARELSRKDQDDIRKEEEWRKWVDEHFIHLIVPNVYRTWDECIQMFRWFSKAGQWDELVPAWERYLTVYFGSIAMFFLSKRLRKKYGDDDVRQLLIDSCNEWLQAVGNSPFLGGQQPNLADLALYGAMNSFVGSETFDEICRKTEIKEWFERMQQAVDTKAGAIVLEKCSRKKAHL